MFDIYNLWCLNHSLKILILLYWLKQNLKNCSLFNEFYQLFNPSADIPNSIKEITNFGENYLYEIKQEYEQKNYKYFKNSKQTCLNIV